LLSLLLSSVALVIYRWKTNIKYTYIKNKLKFTENNVGQKIGNIRRTFKK